MRHSNKSVLISFLIIGIAVLISSALVVEATSKDDIVYPVRELGSCKNEAECRSFCDERNNLERVRACLAFAKKHNLLPPEELEEADRYVTRLGIATGPGGCRNQRECDAYCENTANLNECLDFAERYSLRSAEEVAEGRKVAAALREGGTLPGGCRNKNECMAYCEDPLHMRECVAFAEKAGFISSREAEEAKKIIPLLERGEKTPGNCGRKEACEAYCAEPAHIDECLAFAEKAGIIPAEELAEAKKVARFIKSGETPGRCRRKAECEVYCSDAAHLDECLAFAEKAGIIPAEELAEAKRMVSFIKSGETPGKCRGKAECEAYCQDVSHFEECVAFGEKAGLLSKEEAELAKKFKGTGPGGCKSRQDCEELCKDPANQETCLNFAQEHGLLDEASGIEAEARAQAEAEGRAKAEAEIRACTQKPCEEMIACFQGVQASAGGDGGGHEGEDGGSGEAGLPADVQERLNACIAEITAQKLKEAGAGGDEHPAGIIPQTFPPSQTPQSEDASKEYQKQYEEQYQKQYEEEYQKQYQEQVKSQVDCSLFEAAPTCDYAGAPGSQNYDLCKQCFPNK